MSPEGITRLRQRIDKLTEERDYYKARFKPRRTYFARCVYCSAKCRSYGLPATCPAHRDLVALDSFYAEAAVA